MKKNILLLILICTSFLFINWGSKGHYWISRKSTESFPVSMSTYMIWRDSLANHASDADDRKSWDPDESMRHYINLDSYAEFLSTGHIPSTFDSAVSAHSLYFVEDKGTLPWATKIMYDSLVMAFQQQNWHAAMLHAADLGHYVGDGHMPLHLTKNYDGQYTGQNGIHSRYESDLVWDYYNYFINYSGDSVQFIGNVQLYIFDYIYVNYNYVDSILDADTYASTVAGNNTSTQYYQQFFNKARNFTITMWHNASHALAELIYTAWVEAGSPQMFTDIIKPIPLETAEMVFYPNPVSSTSFCKFTLLKAENVEWRVFDLSGKQVLAINKNCVAGENKVLFDFSGLQQGAYYCVMQTLSQNDCSSFVIMP